MNTDATITDPVIDSSKTESWYNSSNETFSGTAKNATRVTYTYQYKPLSSDATTVANDCNLQHNGDQTVTWTCMIKNLGAGGTSGSVTFTAYNGDVSKESESVYKFTVPRSS